MRKYWKLIGLFLVPLLFSCFSSCRNNDGPTNPYLHMRERPSQKLSRENKAHEKKVERRTRKRIKEQKRAVNSH